jgi:hypothetical protein
MFFSGPLHFRADGLNYSLHVPLQTPFLFDPAVGNLLLDVRNYQTIAPTSENHLLVATDTPADTVSIAIAADVNALSGATGSQGLQVLFDVTPIPEPSAICLIFIGFAFTGGSVAFRRNRSRRSHALCERLLCSLF